jgi:hypothetical protein
LLKYLEVSTIFSIFAIDKERTIKVEQFKSAIMEKETYNYVVGLILANVGEITAAYIDAAMKMRYGCANIKDMIRAMRKLPEEERKRVIKTAIKGMNDMTAMRNALAQYESEIVSMLINEM